MRWPTLKRELAKWQKTTQQQPEPSPAQVPDPMPEPPRAKPPERVVGGSVQWKPIDKTAALVVARAPWLCREQDLRQHPLFKPPPEPEPKPKKQKRMKTINETTLTPQNRVGPGNDFVSTAGVHCKTVNGEVVMSLEDIKRLIMDEIAEDHKKIPPMAKQAAESRLVMDELFNGIARDHEAFSKSARIYLEDIRQIRFAVVGETAAMSRELKDVRQFFLGSDYKDQITRLKEFVDLCERLAKLKEGGVLDAISDTMLRLAEKP